MKSADEKGFCFFARCDNNVLATNEVDIIIYSACTNCMLKDRELFATLDEIFWDLLAVQTILNPKLKVRVGLNFMCVRIMERQQK